MNLSTGQVTFTGDGSVDSLILSRWETSPGSGTFVLRHNVSGGGLNSFIDLDPGTAGNQTMTLGSGSDRNIIVSLGGANDVLTIDNSWTFNHKVTFSGEAGTDTLVGNNAGNTWQVSDVTTFAGNLTTGSDKVSFSGVETLTGGVGSNADTLQGENAARTWNLAATHTYTDGSNTLTFSDMEVLQGGSNVDTFNLKADTTVTSLNGGAGNDVYAFYLNTGAPVTLSGNIDGEAGSDTLSYSNYSTTGGVVAVLTGAGSSDGFAGTEVSISGSFTNIDVLTGGGTSDDSLTGRNAAASWGIDGSNQYVSTNTLDFSAVEHLAGGTGVDTFTVTANHSGNLSGDDGADVFNFNGATLTGDVAGDAGADDFNFAGGSITGTVTGDAGNDTFDVTANASVSGGLLGGDDDDAVTVSGASVVLTANVSGNAGNDSVTLSDSASITGSVAGNAGTDTVSFAGYGSARAVSLTALGSTDGFNGSEASISGGFSDVNVLTGSSGTDSLTGRNAAAVWEVDGSNRYVDVGTSTAIAFSAIEGLVGGSVVDTFDVTAAFTGTLTGNAGADDFNISAALTGSATGDAGNDTFDLSAAGSVSGSVNGGADNDALTLAGTSSVGSFAGAGGTDTLSYVGRDSAASVTLSAVGSTDGFDGSGSGVTAFTDVNVLVGSASGSDALTGRDATATWEVDGSNRYLNGATELAFSAVENLNGGSGADTFDVTAAHTGALAGNGGADDFNVSAALTGSASGNAGDDTFDLSGSGSVSGNVDGGADNDALTLAGTSSVGGAYAGGAGTDTLSFAGYGSARSVTLTAVGSTDGFNGSEASITGGFTDVNVLTGSSSGSDALIGRNATATWEVDGSNRYLNGATALAFSAVEDLTGGTAVDTFDVSASHSGNLSGGDGGDDFNVSSTAVLTGNVSGGAGNDTIDLSNSASVVGTIDGGADNDTITLANSASITGSVVGGAGSDGLSYSGYGSAASIVLGGPAVADGYNGVASGISGSFSTIDAVTGSSNSDSLTGSFTDSLWTFDSSYTYNDGQVANNLTFAGFESLVGSAGADTFKVMNNTAYTGSINGGVGANQIDYSDASNTTGISVSISGTNAGSIASAFSFSGIGTLKGSAGNDTFTFTANGARVTGTINGQGGSNTLSYSGYTSAVRVSLAAGSATGTAGVSNVVHVTGGSGNDILIGNSSDNTLSGGGGNDIVSGGGGADNLGGDAGNDILLGGAAADVLNGGADDDVLIGGVTTYDSNLAALNALMAEWGRTSVPYATRVGRISGTVTGGLNGSYRLTDSTVNDDTAAVDSLTGGAGLDWFFSTGDTIQDLNTGGSETQSNVS